MGKVEKNLVENTLIIVLVLYTLHIIQVSIGAVFNTQIYL